MAIMRREWSHYVRLLLWGLLLCLSLGIAIDEPAWVITAGLSAYVGWTLRQTYRLHRWLYKSPEAGTPPPESKGLWGDLFDGIYETQQHHAKAQKRLQDLVNRIQQSSNALHDGVILVNARGEMEWWNKAASRLLGFHENRDRGQIIYNLVRQPEFKRYFDNKVYEDPIEVFSPEYPNLRIQFHITLFGENERIIQVHDVTRLYQLEQMRKDFVSNVSHEMRTPLTVITGYLETIEDNLDTFPKKWHRSVRTMTAQSQRMESLITDLLLLAKVETSEKAQTNRIAQIKPLLESIQQDAIALSAEKGHDITLNIECQSAFLGDENQLRSAFSNLVFNAVKYTQASGRIGLRWWSDAKGVHFRVSDNGPGFDPIHIPRLTERFYRVDAGRQSSVGGTGLGLAIVKHVVINHDGELEIHTAPGQGCEFTCHFPLFRKINDLSLGSKRQSA